MATFETWDRETLDRFAHDAANELASRSEKLTAMDKMLCDIFKRRVAVEERLLRMAAGKEPLPDAETCRDMATMLGVPGESVGNDV